MSEHRIDHEPWPLRAAILCALGLLFGLIFHAIISDGKWSWTDEPARVAGAVTVAVAGLVFAFTLERLRWQWSAAFAAVSAIVAGGIVYWNAGSDEWRFVSLLAAVAVAMSLFQVLRDEGRRSLPPAALHAHLWTNAVLWCAAWAFVGIVFLLTLLLSALFGLIGIDFLEDLIDEAWFDAMLAGGALGAAIGLLRDRDKVLGLLQRVVTIVLSMLSPVLALGLGLFLLSLPFTGLGPLWRETSSTTPILLSCAIVALLFANATIGNAPDEEPRHRVLRYAALVLALVVLPLAVIAAVSTGMRIDQYGFTPDRLWAATFILIVLVCGIAYLAVAVLGRAAWIERLRRANVMLAVGLCALAVLLATPIVNFAAISTRDQIGRLVAGTIAPDRFDWRALAFDFGPSGRRALETLSKTGPTAPIRAEAAKALTYEDRYDAPTPEQQIRQRAALANARVLPKRVALPSSLEAEIAESYNCAPVRPCTILYEAGSDQAVVVQQPSCVPTTLAEDGSRLATVPAAQPGCEASTRIFRRIGDRWVSGQAAVAGPENDPSQVEADQRVRGGWQAGTVEVRPVQRRQVFIGGEPVGDAFE